MEGADLTAAQPRAHELRGVAALLHGDRRDAREPQRLPVLPAHADHVAEREHLGMPGQAEVGFDHDAARAVELGARQVRELRRERGGGDPRGPDDGPRGDRLGRPVGRLDRDGVLVDADDPALE